MNLMKNLGSARSIAVKSVVVSSMAILALFHDGHALTRKKIDFVVGVNGDFKAAMAAAAKASGRFIMFFPDGNYDIGSLTGDANQQTTFSTPNVSFIGQSEDKTVLFNKPKSEGLSVSATLVFNKADNLYMQDMSILNKADYVGPTTSTQTARWTTIAERSNKMIYKNVRLLSTQDTYYTKGTRTYWEGGQIHGTTDFICGNGDVFFNKVLLWVMKASAITAPATTTPWGYVFKDCTIDGTASGYNLGRSWGTARAAYLNTTMKKLASSGGWGNDMNSAPQLFAEYKSVTATGTAVDMSKRVKSTILTDAESAKFTVSNVLKGNDNWQPDVLAKQVAAPVVSKSGNKLTWADDPEVLYWVIFKDGKYLDNVTTNSYDSSAVSGSNITVRAANSMGGLSSVNTATSVLSGGSPASKGIVQESRHLVVDAFADLPVCVSIRNIAGKHVRNVDLPASNGLRFVDLSILGLEQGIYFATATVSGRAPLSTPIRIIR